MSNFTIISYMEADRTPGDVDPSEFVGTTIEDRECWFAHIKTDETGKSFAWVPNADLEHVNIAGQQEDTAPPRPYLISDSYADLLGLP